MNYLVFDIETVPDLKLWQPAPPKPRARKKDEFPPLYAHRPIAIGFALFDEALSLHHLGCVGHDDEPKLIADFTSWIATLPDAVLVSFNGRGFDVPVLGLRALRLGIDQRFNTPAHRKRYSEEHHLDLFDALTEFGAIGRTGFSLSALSQVIGMAGMEDTGAQIEAMYQRKEIAKIHGKCTQDIVRTSFLLFRYLLMRGRITLDEYRTAARSLWGVCLERQLAGVSFAADQKTLLLEA